MAEFVPVDARSVANYLLIRGMAEGMPLDPMKLLKLTYISHGWTLGITGQSLFANEVEAWRYGPVVREVYEAFKNYGASAIQSPAVSYEHSGAKVFNESFLPAVPIVDRVWDRYKDFTGLQLSTLTHRPNTPWAEVTKGKKPEEIYSIPIPNELIRDHYRKLAMNGRSG